MKKKILITWWLWYIGSHAVVVFEQAGYETIIIDNLSNTTLAQYDGIEYILWHRPTYYQADITDAQALEKIFSDHDIDGVIHFAWLKAVGESCEQPFRYYENNIVGSLRLFEAMQNHDVKKLIFSSSATVYHPKSLAKINGTSEVDRLWNISNPYGNTKHIIELMLEDMAKHKSRSIASLRYFNPIGAHPSGHIGENPQWIPNNLLPYVLQVAKGQREFVGVFGNDYDTIDGTWVRDYIDVNDLVNWHLKAYSYIENHKEWIEFINLWSWAWTSVLQIIASTEKVTKKPIPYRILARRAGDLPCFFAQPEKAKKILNWKSETLIDDSIKNSRKFMQNQKEL